MCGAAASVFGPQFCIAAPSCEPPHLLSPTLKTIATAQPLIKWSAVSGATSYRLQINSRALEDKIIAQIDTQVTGTRYQVAQPLAESTARVAVVIIANCGEGAADVVRGTGRFYIDLRPLCVLESATVGRNTDNWRVTWPEVSGVASYEVAVYDRAGRLLAANTVRDQQFLVAADERGPAAVAITPHCTNSVGAPVVRALLR